MRFSKKHGLATGAVVLAVFVAAPAIGAAGSGSSHGKQPPPGTVTHVTHAAPVAKQPAQGTVTRTTDASAVPKQPVNRNPKQKVGKSLTILRHSKSDRGVKNVRATKDEGKKNAPITRG